MEFFLAVFVIFLIIIIFAFTFMVINQSFTEKRNQQLESYKATFKEVPKLLKVKIVFQEGTNTIVLPTDIVDSKLTTVFVNAPKGTKITFSPYPGAPADVYEKVSESGGVLAGDNSSTQVLHFSEITFGSVNWTKNGVPISDEEVSQVFIPTDIPVVVESTQDFGVNIDKKIETIDIALAQGIGNLDLNRGYDVNIISSIFDSNNSYIGTRTVVTDRNDHDRNIRAIVIDSNAIRVDTNISTISEDFNVYDGNNSIIVLPSDSNLSISDCSLTSGIVCGQFLPAGCTPTSATTIAPTCTNSATKISYANTCELHSAGATFLHNGPCETCYPVATKVESTSVPCCAGLTKIPYTYNDISGQITSTSIKICSNCGNSICESWESPLTCSSDCKTIVIPPIVDVNSTNPNTCGCSTTENNPVCGIDGNTYPTPCFASCHSTSIGYVGNCISGVKYCGGTSNVTCPTGFTCLKDTDAVKSTGKCMASSTITDPTTVPAACALCSTTESNPVCGIDGNTYATMCFSNCHNINVGYIGACIANTKYCGGLTSAICPSGYFCQYDYSGVANSTGKCVTSSTTDSTTGTNTISSCINTCPSALNPVCGINGVTFGNSCYANCNSVSIGYVGNCISGVNYCGGTSNATCPTGFTCLKDFPTAPNSTGRCVTSTGSISG